MLCLVSITISAQTICYVSPDGDDSSGNSWATAFRTISNGVSHATGVTNTVLVSNGIYTISTPIVISSAITVTSLNGRAWTSVNGGGTSKCLQINHSNAVVDGFTISNGCTETTDYNSSGGGVRLSRGLLRNCEVSRNTANRYGGGICFDETSTNAMALDCLIANNQTTQTVTYSFGGGVYLQGNGSIVSGCTIQGNSCLIRGGGVFVSRGQALLIDRCVISNNTASSSYGGGIHFDGTWSLVSATASYCTVVNNIGAGVKFDYGAPATVENSTIARNTRGVYFTGTTNFVALAKNCIVNENSNATDVCGGIYFSQGGTAQNCQIVSNYSTFDGGGVYMSKGGRLLNCLVAYNTALPSSSRYGGGVLMHTMTQDNGSAVSACTIVSNVAYRGGGMCFTLSTNTNFVVNCIIASNTASNAGNDFYDASSQSSNAFCYSCINIGTLATDKNNITNREPLFVGSAVGNFRLQSASPCIDAGINEAWMNGALDLDGRPRWDRFRGQVDMGAYEHLSEGTLFMMR